MAIFNEKVIKVTEYTLLEKLPDPFMKADGQRVKTAEEFEEHKKELYKSAVELQYGTMPPAPEFLEVETLFTSNKPSRLLGMIITHASPLYCVIKRSIVSNRCVYIICYDINHICILNFYKNTSFIRTLIKNMNKNP